MLILSFSIIVDFDGEYKGVLAMSKRFLKSQLPQEFPPLSHYEQTFAVIPHRKAVDAVITPKRGPKVPMEFPHREGIIERYSVTVILHRYDPPLESTTAHCIVDCNIIQKRSELRVN
jgi:hypothetical protein